MAGCRSQVITSAGSGSASSSGSSGITRSATISWAANRENAVNKSGGGYYVYVGSSPGFSLPGIQSVVVPYVSGATAPTSTTISGLSSGTTYYFKVIAYSTYSTSLASTETSIAVP